MARRRAAKRRRRSRTFSILNGIEAYTYASILTNGAFGTTPFGFFKGEGDVTYQAYGAGAGYYGLDQISLMDIVKEPGQALQVASNNLQSSLVPMAIQSMLVSVGFRLGKRLLSRPIGNINRNIMTPLLGKTIKV